MVAVRTVQSKIPVEKMKIPRMCLGDDLLSIRQFYYTAAL
jgi:hypothetical protein